MPDVDERVVEMKFNNQGFAEKVGGTISILQKLREKLSFKGAEKGLQDIEAAQRGVKFDQMAAAVEGMSQKFSAMGAVAFSVINNIVTKAIDAGMRITQAFAFGPIKEGFQEWETNMNSIQTILANTKSKGSTLDDVNAALQQLNEYSDKTIYNFSQMAKNIGTFTAAGVDLDTSVNAIKGIANLAAISGSNSEQASTAMYQLSQALAAGKVSLMDWNSVVNAGMGGEVFKSALFETAKAKGELNFAGTFQEWEKAGNSFRESLQDGWLTKDVLTNTLQAFTGDLTEAQLLSMGYTVEQAKQMMELGKLGVAAATEVKTVTQLMGTIKEAIATGWADSFRIVLGDFEEAKTLLTSINNVVSGVVGRWAEARNDLLRGWKFLGGREALINGLKEVMTGLGEAFRTVGEAWRDVFPKMDGWKLLELTDGFVKFLKSLVPTQDQLVHIRSIFQGVFSVLAIGWEVVKNIFSAFKQLFSAFGSNAGGDILWFFSDLGMELIALKETLVDGGGIKDFFDKFVPQVADAIKKLDLSGPIQFIKNAFMTLGAVLGAVFLFVKNLNIPEVFSKVASALGEIKSAFTDFLGSRNAVGELNESSGALAERWGWLGDAGSKLGVALDWLADKFSVVAGEAKNLIGALLESLKTANFDNVTDLLNVGILGGIAVGFKKLYDKFSNFSGEGFMEKIDSVLESVTDTLAAMQAQLKSEALLNIAKAVGVLAISLVVLSLIDSAKLTKALAATAAGFAQLAATMAVLAKIEMGPRGALKVNAIASALILLGAALVIFSLAVKIMSTMDSDELTRGLFGVAALLTMMTAAIKALPDPAHMFATGVGIMAIAAAILILTIPVKLLSMMDINAMMQGLLGVALLLTGITIAVKNMGDPAHMFATGLGIMAIAVALLILVAPVKLLGDMDVERMMQGLLGVALLLAALTVAVKNMPNNMAVTGLGLMIMAGALAVITAAVFVLGTMDIISMVQGLAAVAIVLGVLVLAANALNGALAGAIAIIILSGALVILAAAMNLFAKLGIGGLLIGLVAIAAVLLIFAVAASALTPLIPAMFALGLAMAAFGLGLALVGASVFLVGAGLFFIVKAIGALVALVIDSADGVVATIDLIINKVIEFTQKLFDAMLEMGKKFIDSLPEIFSGLGEAIITLLNEIDAVLPEVFQTIDIFLAGLLQLIRDRVPDFILTGMAIITALLTGIKDNIAQITNLVVDIIKRFSETLQSRMEEIVSAGADLIIAFLNGLSSKVPDIALAAGLLIVSVINAMGELHWMIIEAGINLVVRLIDGIGTKITEVIEAGKNLVLKILEGLGSAGVEIANGIANLITVFLLAIAMNYQKLIDAGGDMLLKILEGTTSKITEIGDAAAKIIIDFINELADSIRDNSEGLRAAGANLAGAIVDGFTGGMASRAGDVLSGAQEMGENFFGGVVEFFDVRSPSKKMRDLGLNVVDGFVLGLGQNGRVSQQAESLGNNVTSALTKAIEEVSSVANAMEDFQPRITPVLDLTKVTDEAKAFDSLFGGEALSAASLNQARVLSEQTAAQQEAAIEPTQPTEIKFEQIINAPSELSTGEIYRNTKSQLALAKERLTT